MRGVGLIILAAGGSTRLGRPKQLLNFRGRSLLRHAAETGLASECRTVVVVLGANSERMEPELDGLEVCVIRNPLWEQGMSSSIRTGLGALAIHGSDLGLPDAVLITVCDQPLMSPHVLNRLIGVHRATRAGIVAAEYGDSLGVPALFTRTYYPQLVSLPENAGAKQLFKQYPWDLQSIPFPEGSFDIDTEEDTQALAALA